MEKRFRVIYIAGKYYGKSYSEIDDNIHRAEKVSLKLLLKGFCVLTPHLNTAHFERYSFITGFDLNKWLELDFELLRRCDCIFLMSGWEDSLGAVEEHKFAKEHKIKIYYESEGIPESDETKGKEK